MAWFTSYELARVWGWVLLHRYWLTLLEFWRFGGCFVTSNCQGFDLVFYTLLDKNMKNTKDLPKCDVWTVEFDRDGEMEEYFYRNEKNAKSKFDELVKKYDLQVKGCYAKDGRSYSVWMWKITFED